MARPESETIERDLTRSHAALTSGKPEEAVAILRRATAKHPTEPRLFANLVNALERLGRHAEALDVARQAVRIRPETAYSHANLAALSKFAGDLDTARTHYRRAIELAPDHADAWRGLAGLKRFTDPADTDLVAMRALLEQLPPSDHRRIPLSFAVGRALEELGDVDGAFLLYERGGRMQRARLTHDVAIFDRILDRAYTLFAGEALDRGPVAGASTEAPILVVGMPRSGTTLVEQVLASHPDVVGVGECTELQRLTRPLGADTESRLVALAAMGDSELAALGAEYVARLRARAGDPSKRIVDKSLDNHLFAGVLARALPNARFVHVVRSPLDNVLSSFKTLFTSPLAYTYDQTELARAYVAVNRLGRRWRERLPANVIEVSYEAFVADQAGETRRLLDFLGLPWSEACLAFEKTVRRVDSASSLQVRQPLFKSSVGSARAFERHLRPARAVFAKLGVAT